MQRSSVETILGGIVLITALGFGFMLYNQQSLLPAETYALFANFDRIDGVKRGSDIKISGITVGKVIESHLDPKTFLAQVKLEIDKNIQLPVDSSLEISSDGLFGKKFLTITMGSDTQTIGANGTISYTQAGADLMQLLNKFMFSQKPEENQQKGQSPSVDQSSKSLHNN